jgi:hypothetical protein
MKKEMFQCRPGDVIAAYFHRRQLTLVNGLVDLSEALIEHLGDFLGSKQRMLQR